TATRRSSAPRRRDAPTWRARCSRRAPTPTSPTRTRRRRCGRPPATTRPTSWPCSSSTRPTSSSRTRTATPPSPTPPRPATPLPQAARRGNPTVVDQLLKGGADTHGREKTAVLLRAAASGGNASVVERAIGLGGDVNAGDSDGETAIFYAARSGKQEAIRALA